VTRPDPSFIEEMESLQDAYLAHDDPMMQSGYFGGRDRWFAVTGTATVGDPPNSNFAWVGV
jgi:hypothetical protein